MLGSKCYAVLKFLIKEPLVHFLALGLAVFLLNGALNPSDETSPDEIVISSARIEQLTGLYAKTWQRPPSAQELKGLIDDYVKEEIYYREALALGLDKDDTVIRRRLRLKMEFLSAADAEAAIPQDADLEAYIKANPKTFERDAMIAFRQVFLSPERRGDKIDQDVATVLEVLRANSSVDLSTIGDATLLPSQLPLTSTSSIAQAFGAPFADQVAEVSPSVWTGPIKSSFGLHIIYVSEHTPGRVPGLAEIRDDVAREWLNDKRKSQEEQRLAEFLKRYKVRIEANPQDAALAEPAP